MKKIEQMAREFAATHADDKATAVFLAFGCETGIRAGLEMAAQACAKVSDGYMDKTRPETINVERSNGAEKCLAAIRQFGEAEEAT